MPTNTPASLAAPCSATCTFAGAAPVAPPGALVAAAAGALVGAGAAACGGAGCGAAAGWLAPPQAASHSSPPSAPTRAAHPVRRLDELTAVLTRFESTPAQSKV